jgi:hypothetical protein
MSTFRSTSPESSRSIGASGNSQAARRRNIGPIGTIARVVLGLSLLGLGMLGGVLGGQVVLINGQLHSHLDLLSLILGVGALPALALGLQWLWVRRAPAPFQATGSMSTSLNMLIFFALVLTPMYAPRIALVGFAALDFYGVSMLVAALWGYAGCEVLAISNWILHRDDQVGCFALGPLDAAEQRTTIAGSARSKVS